MQPSGYQKRVRETEASIQGIASALGIATQLLSVVYDPDPTGKGKDYVIETELYPYTLADLPSEQWPRYREQLFDLVDRLHTAGIYHLDLSEENIVVSETGVVKLIDFGLSRFIPELLRIEKDDPGYVSREYQDLSDYSTVEDLHRHDLDNIDLLAPE